MSKVKELKELLFDNDWKEVKAQARKLFTDICKELNISSTSKDCDQLLLKFYNDSVIYDIKTTFKDFKESMIQDL